MTGPQRKVDPTRTTTTAEPYRIDEYGRLFIGDEEVPPDARIEMSVRQYVRDLIAAVSVPPARSRHDERRRS